MISKDYALRLIARFSRRSHSVLASEIMRALAEKLGENIDEWELVGLLHDLDYDHVKGDMSKHGLVTAQTLKDKLSPSALHAIRAHDYHTGIKPTSILDNALIAADMVATLVEDLQAQNTPITLKALRNMLHRQTSQKPWLKTLTQTRKTIGIPTKQLLKTAIEAMPTQHS